MVRRFLLLFTALLVLASCGSEKREDESNGFVIQETIESEALKGNMLDTPTEQKLLVLLPPSYYKNKKNYPVVYYFHGHGGSFSEIYGTFGQTAQRKMEKGSAKEFIFVGVSGNNKFGGGFYANSIVSGNWEDHIINEVVPFVDKHYRTLTNRESRGLLGFSMGGFGALYVGMRHPDMFNLIYSIGPGSFDKNGLKDALTDNSWDMTFKNAYGAAFSPNPDLQSPYAEIPKLDGTPEDERILSNWEKGFGDLENKISDYLAKGMAIEYLTLEYGSSDGYAWIPKGTVYFSKLMDENGIKHNLIEFTQGHTVSFDSINSFMKFFDDNLRF